MTIGVGMGLCQFCCMSLSCLAWVLLYMYLHVIISAFLPEYYPTCIKVDFWHNYFFIYVQLLYLFTCAFPLYVPSVLA